MSLFSKILLGLVGLVVVYALWPRSPAIHHIKPAPAAAQETKAWQAIHDRNYLKTAFRYYLLYDLEFGISPVQAWNMARANSSAISKVLFTKDVAEQESKIPEFIEIYTILQRETGAAISSADVGRAAYGIWVRMADGATEEQLRDAIISYWGLLFLQPALDLRKPATLRAQAMLLAFGGQRAEPDWEKVQGLLSESWSELIANFPQRTDTP